MPPVRFADDPDDTATVIYLQQLIARIERGESLNTFDHALISLNADFHKLYQGEISEADMRESVESSLDMLREFAF
jgi:hypothetical protein